jgi:hypothetical protein
MQKAPREPGGLSDRAEAFDPRQDDLALRFRQETSITSMFGALTERLALVEEWADLFPRKENNTQLCLGQTAMA